MGRFVQIAMRIGALNSNITFYSRTICGFLKDEDYAHLNSAIDRVLRMLSALLVKIKNVTAA